MAKKLPIPDDLATPYAVPDDLTSLEDIDALIEAAVTAGRGIFDANATPGDDDVRRAEWLADAADTLGAKREELAAAEAERAEKVNAVRDRFGKPAGEDDGDGGEPAATPAQPPADAAAPTETQPVLVAGGNKIAEVARHAPRPSAAGTPVRRNDRVSLIAAADVPDFAAGQQVDLHDPEQLGNLFINRARALGGQGRQQVGFASLRALPNRDALIASGKPNEGPYTDIDQALDAALKAYDGAETGGALLASSGWCSPSETLYDLLDLTTADGLINLPSITVSRGGVRFTKGPDFTAVYTAGGMFTQTEAQNIANTAKPSVSIPCPGFTDNRLSADGLFLTGGVLQELGYPEAVADFITKSLKAFEHYQSGKTIADMVSQSGTLIDYTTGTGVNPVGAANPELLGVVELLITHARYVGRLSLNTPLEVILPVWIKGVLRSDLAKRNNVDLLTVTDAQLVEFFTIRGAMPQFVYDWQDATVGGPTVATMGGATPPVAWPANVQVLVYPAGTFQRAMGDVLQLSSVYDSTLLATNQKVQLFLERSRLTIMRGFQSYVAKVPVPPTGVPSAAATQPTV